MKLQELFPDFPEIETSTFECKVRLNHDRVEDWLKTICAFANTKGGTLLLGVADRSFEVQGYSAQEADEERNFAQNQVNIHCQYELNIIYRALPYLVENGQKRYLLSIEVPESPSKPIIFRFNGMPSVFIRLDGRTAIPSDSQFMNMVKQCNLVIFDKQKTAIEYDPRDFSTLGSYYQSQKGGAELTDKELESISFYDLSDRRLYMGSYMFSDRYQSDKTRVSCTVYSSFDRGSSSLLASNDFTGNLLSVYTRVRFFLSAFQKTKLIKLPQGRKNIPAYPERALTEALINALAHRDYLLEGTEIAINVFPNRLVINSPGSLLGREEIPPTYNLAQFSSVRRNEKIAAVFNVLGLMDKKGTGFEKIMDEYKSYGPTHQPYISSFGERFLIVLPDLTYDDGIAIEEDSLHLVKPVTTPSPHDNRILAYCYGRKRTASEIAAYLSLTNSTYFRDSILAHLAAEGFLLLIEGKGTKHYQTNPEMVIKG